MKNVNSCVLVGTLWKDAETRTAQSGSTFVTLGVTTREAWKQNGAWQERKQFHRVVVYNDESAKLCGNLKKGDAISISGQVEHRKWEKDGQPQYITEIVVRQFTGYAFPVGGVPREVFDSAVPANNPANADDVNTASPF